MRTKSAWKLPARPSGGPQTAKSASRTTSPDTKGDQAAMSAQPKSLIRCSIRSVEQRSRASRCRAIAAQFMDEHVIALFELTLEHDEVRVVEERHYRLVPARELDREAIRSYRDD